MRTLSPEQQAKLQAARIKVSLTPRKSRTAKMAAYRESFANMRRQFPRYALPLINKAETGSLPAAIKLMCLDCSGHNKREVRDCVITGCPLYPHRPFQQIGGKNHNDLDYPAGWPSKKERKALGLPAAVAAQEATDART